MLKANNYMDILGGLFIWGRVLRRNLTKEEESRLLSMPGATVGVYVPKVAGVTECGQLQWMELSLSTFFSFFFFRTLSPFMQ